MFETRKILGDESIRDRASPARACRSSTGHSESVNVQTREPLSVERGARAARGAPGVDGRRRPGRRRATRRRSTPAGRDDVFVGRLRRDPSHERGLQHVGRLATTCSRAPRPTRSRSPRCCTSGIWSAFRHAPKRRFSRAASGASRTATETFRGGLGYANRTREGGPTSGPLYSLNGADEIPHSRARPAPREHRDRLRQAACAVEGLRRLPAGSEVHRHDAHDQAGHPGVVGLRAGDVRARHQQDRRAHVHLRAGRVRGDPLRPADRPVRHAARPARPLGAGVRGDRRAAADVRRPPAGGHLDRAPGQEELQLPDDRRGHPQVGEALRPDPGAAAS